MNGYQALISEATGCHAPNVLSEVEDIMRNVIFHSTLDWQSREAFIQGAKDAFEVYTVMRKKEDDT